jgi:hypothetical protein
VAIRFCRFSRRAAFRHQLLAAGALRSVVSSYVGLGPHGSARGFSGAAGHTYDVQVLATDDSGATQGFHRAGTVTVVWKPSGYMARAVGSKQTSTPSSRHSVRSRAIGRG